MTQRIRASLAPAERRSEETRTASTSNREEPRRAMPGTRVSCMVATATPEPSRASSRTFESEASHRGEGRRVGLPICRVGDVAPGSAHRVVGQEGHQHVQVLGAGRGKHQLSGAGGQGHGRLSEAIMQT